MPIAQAVETQDIVDMNGVPIFRVRFFDVGDGAYGSDNGKEGLFGAQYVAARTG